MRMFSAYVRLHCTQLSGFRRLSLLANLTEKVGLFPQQISMLSTEDLVPERQRCQLSPAAQPAQIPGYVQPPVVDPQNATLMDAVVQLTTLLTNQQAMDMHQRQQQTA